MKPLVHESVNMPEAVLRVLERERSARKQAEELLKDKCRQLYKFNNELKQSALALEREVQRNKAVFDTAAEGIIIFEEDGRIESLNDAARKIFDLPNDDGLQLTICDILPSTVFCDTSEGYCFATELRNHINKSDEIMGQRRGGSEVPVEFVVSEFVHGGKRSFSGIVRDLTKRKALEAQLAHAQKLESVGSLAAGIAHELNTPIQFVGDNTRFLKTTFEDFDRIFDLYDQLISALETGNDTSRNVSELTLAYKEVDIEFLRSEVPLAIDQTLQGAENVARIVRAMKVFSHPGTSDFQEIDLNSALESTLTVSRNEWKYCAELETSYDQNLPKIMCLPGELNQVFLKLIVNAAHAIQARHNKSLGKLTISTRTEGDRVIVDIGDNGTGIPSTIRNRIYDPFFTTKGVGKGTGQGLAISYSIVVEMHKGSLTFDSEEGIGTTFHVSLPLDPRSLQ